ncbi:Ppx/GppA phosphatase family protein [Salisaeta longa]|uniref:Ppx/GppA phosphatase family protein n=1 Tax=Salisaeta longa TaxID=503170 RepID=UPI0003B53314|nr:Ppx/GppA phosphatase family protein [Salisaeta longa]
MPSSVRERTACIHLPHTSYEANGAASPVRLCVIDLGTNSFHAVIVDAHPNGSFKVIDRMKEMVRLGEHGLMDHVLPPEAMERGVQALRRIDLLARGWNVREFLAYATSAIREAQNGGAFIERVWDTLGLRIRPISGAQEAQLIYQGVARAVDLSEPSMIVDVGGGSVEFIVVAKGTVHLATSLKLGAARMTEQFVTTDPITPDEQDAMRAHFRMSLEAVLEAARAHRVETIVGSSGTVKSLARVCVNAHGDGERTIFQQDLAAGDFRTALRRVIDAAAEERMALAAIDPQRADQIGAGALLMDELLAQLPIRRLRVSSHALREGMVVQFIEDNYQRLRYLAPFRTVRRRSVYEIGFRFSWEEQHAQHVAATAGLLFDVCAPLYAGPAADAELLEYAALLHDVGYHINHPDHHLHSHYLIQNADLRGFQPLEVSIIALVARYHRGASPDATHPSFAALTPAQQQRVRKLSVLLRIAEGLDRSHFQNVRALRLALTSERLTLALHTNADPELEVWAVRQEAARFEDTFGRTLTVTTTDDLLTGNVPPAAMAP